MDSLQFIEQEAQALLVRVERMRTLLTQENMVPAAAPARAAAQAIESHVETGRRQLRRQLQLFQRDLRQAPAWRAAPVALAQRRFVLLRMRCAAFIAQYDLFCDALSQRSERDTGLWLAGLEAAADDAMRTAAPQPLPPVLCYLDRGLGAAIRRAHTRLPGGSANPVALIRMPRERMVGSGIAASLAHEAGHQVAAQLGLLPALRDALRQQGAGQAPAVAAVWRAWERWLGEIVADLWALARIGIGATLGLMAVLSLPRAFVFRIGLDDPHPPPALRVALGCVLGHALHPHPQWQAWAATWDELYPAPAGAAAAELACLRASLPALAGVLLAQRPAALGGACLGDAWRDPLRAPVRLRRLWPERGAGAPALHALSPCLALAVAGQARADGRLAPAAEAALVDELLQHWALCRARQALAH